MAKQPLTQKQREMLNRIKGSEDGALRLGGVGHARTTKSLIQRGIIIVEAGFATLTAAGESHVR